MNDIIANEDIANQDIANEDIVNQDISNEDIFNQDIRISHPRAISLTHRMGCVLDCPAATRAGSLNEVSSD